MSDGVTVATASHNRRIALLGLGHSVEQCAAAPSRGGPSYGDVVRAVRTLQIAASTRKKRDLCFALARFDNDKAVSTVSGQTRATLRRFEVSAVPRLLLYKRGTLERAPPTPAKMQRNDRPVWFALDTERSTYGPIVSTYELRRRPRLIDIGRSAARDAIAQLAAQRYDANYLQRIFDPDYQWSGGRANSETTDVMRSVLEPLGYDGTYIDDDADEPLQGAEELVLWRRFTRLLRKY